MIITLIGRKGSGKDTIATMLKNKFEEKYKRTPKLMAFASDMKDILVRLFDFPSIDYFNDHDKKENVHPEVLVNWSPRMLMEWFGNKVIRPTFGNTFWSDKLVNKIKELPEDGIVIITDCRFPHEMMALYNSFGTRVKFYYVNANGRIGPLEENASESEKSVFATVREIMLQNIHFTVIENNSGLEELENEVNELFD